jgi:hypothetical protein
MPASPLSRTIWAAPPRASEAAQHAGKFGVASDQRCAKAERFKSPRGARLLKGSQQSVHQDAADLAAQRQGAKGFIGECVPGKAVSKRSNEHVARPCHRLQSLGDIHRVARYRIGFGVARTEPTGNNWPGVDADVQD